MCSLLPEDLHLELTFSFSSLQLVLCCMAAVKRLPVHHLSADYIFWSFGIIRLILSQFECGVTLKLKPVLGGGGGRRQCCTITLPHINRFIKTESAIFVSLTSSLLSDDRHSELILTNIS